MKIIKPIVKIVEVMVLVVLLAILFVVASPLLPTKTIIATYIVTSGSMEPVIPTGSIVFSRPTELSKLNVSDVITFTSPNDSKSVIIHRIVEIVNENGTRSFVTKGDKNDVEDSWVVTPSLIKGKSVGHVPYLGYVINQLKTVKGFAIGIGIPALILIMLEIKKIKEGIDEEVKRRTETEVVKLKNPELLILGILLTGLITLAKPVYAYFSSQVTITEMTLEVANFGNVNPGDVVINEVMWMGAEGNPDDEWLELRNMTDKTIDLGRWTIDNVKNNHQPLMIPASKSIPAGGYFLIAAKQNSSTSMVVEADVINGSLTLDNTDHGNLILRSPDGTVIDQAAGSPWPAGFDAEVKQSMERNDVPGDGLTSSNWHSCVVDGCRGTAYWKVNDKNYGTPGNANLSGNNVVSNNIDTPEVHLEATLGADKHFVTYKLTGKNLRRFVQLTYTLRYMGDQIPQLITGQADMANESQQIQLGVCSANGTCVYPELIKNIELVLTLGKDELARTTIAY